MSLRPKTTAITPMNQSQADVKREGGVSTDELDEKLGLDSSRRFVLAFASLRQQRVDLVHEDDGRLVNARHCEQRSNHLLTLTYLKSPERSVQCHVTTSSSSHFCFDAKLLKRSF